MTLCVVAGELRLIGLRRTLVLVLFGEIVNGDADIVSVGRRLHRNRGNGGMPVWGIIGWRVHSGWIRGRGGGEERGEWIINV